MNPPYDVQILICIEKLWPELDASKHRVGGQNLKIKFKVSKLDQRGWEHTVFVCSSTNG